MRQNAAVTLQKTRKSLSQQGKSFKSWLQEQQRRKLNGLRLCEPVQRAAISSAYFERSSSLLEPSDPGRRCGKAQSSVQAM